MRLTRREFTRLVGLGLGVGATGLPKLADGAGASPLGLPLLNLRLPLHPLLQFGANAEPDKQITVIVQKANLLDRVVAIATACGGQVLEEFPFIKSFAMRVPQGKLLRLLGRADILYISPDATVQRQAAVTADGLETTYPVTVTADQVWMSATYGGTGTGAAVVVIDTGLTPGADFAGGVITVNLNPRASGVTDPHGHGTHVAGIIKGRSAGGGYIGIAPGCTLISARIADDNGAATTADLLRGLQWCYDHRAGVGGSGSIDVVNLSLASGMAESYLTSPICAAVEQLWNNGVVVVCAAGNRGTDLDATWYPPANDPYVITVGATDEGGNSTVAGDTVATFSSRGLTSDLQYKPDLYAPGRKIVSTLASRTCTLARALPERITDGSYLRLSGSSMAAPVVAGVVALLRGRFPNLTPDQIKWLLTAKGQSFRAGPNGRPIVGAQAAAQWAANSRNAIGRANQGLLPALGLLSPILGLLRLTQIDWTAAYWDAAYWDAAYWDAAYWDADTAYD